MNILLIHTPSITIRSRCISSFSSSKHHVLHTQVHITHALEDGAKLECGRNGILCIEQVAHFHNVTKKPGSQDGESKSFAGTRALVGEDLWNREESFDCEPGDAEEVGVSLRLGYEWKKDVYDEKGTCEVAQKAPVSIRKQCQHTISLQPSERATYGFSSLQRQKLYGRVKPISVLSWRCPLKGVCSMLSFALVGLFVKAILSNTNWTNIMLMAWTNNEVA